MKNIIPKIILSSIVVVLFGSIGLLVALARPFHAPGDVARLRKDLAGEVDRGESENSTLPVPPYTRLTLSNRTPRGDFYRYESRLDVEGLWKFYTDKLRQRGWKRDRRMDVASAQVPTSGPVLSFRNNEKKCILYVESGPGFTTTVSVLMVQSGASAPTRFTLRDEHREESRR